MKTESQSTERRSRAASSSAAAIIDGSLGIVAAIVGTVLFAQIGYRFEPKFIVIAAAYVALVMLAARRRGWSLGKYIARLRESPTDSRHSQGQSRL